MNILVQLFWICLAVFESDFEHEFLLALRLLEKVINKLPLDRPGKFPTLISPFFETLFQVF
jgi:hypothetical protein